MQKSQSDSDRESHLLFLSHSRADTKAASALAERIESTPEARKRGLKVWLDKKDLKAGEPWQAQLEQALEHDSTAFAVYVGSGGVVNWVRSETCVALSRAQSDPDYPFIPILSQECGGSEALPAFARLYQGVIDVEREPEEFAKLLRAATRDSGRARLQLVDEPFVGLEAFQAGDAHLFFGRDEEADELVERLKRLDQPRLLMVVGDSGAGKSSLVKAGLVPRYRGGALAKGHDPRSDAVIWHVVETRPRSNPFDALADSVAEGARMIGQGQGNIRELRKMVRGQDPQEVADALRDGAPGNAKILVVIDQFEELFTLSDKTSRRPYIETLLRLARHDSPAELRVVLTMRRDYYNLCREYSDLYACLEDRKRDAKFSVRRMSDKQLRSAIECPLALTNICDSDVFVEQVLADVGDQPGELALLEMALTESWRRRSEFDGDMLQAYTSIGGTAGALANVADEALGKLSEVEQKLAEASLIRLVRLGETGGTTRRVATRDEFSEDAWRVLQKLASEEYHRLIHVGGTASPKETAGDFESQVSDETIEAKGRSPRERDTQQMVETAELAHEALVSQWPQFQEWLQASPNLKRIHDGLIIAAKRWAATTTKRANELLAANRLADALALMNGHPLWLSKQEHAFIVASRRRATVRSLVAKGAVVSLVAVTVTAVWLGYRAEERRVIALARELAAQSELTRNESASYLQRSTLLAVESLGRHPFPFLEGDQAARHSLALLARPVRKMERKSQQWISSAVFSSNGQQVAAVCGDKSARVWQAADGRELAVIDLVRGGDPTKIVAHSVAFSPNGEYLATANSNTVRLWNWSELDEPVWQGPHEGTVYCITFSPDGKRLAVGSGQTARVWEWSASADESHLEVELNGTVYSVAFSPDGKRLATAGEDPNVWVWDANTGEEVKCINNGDTVRCVAFSPDEKHLATASNDRTARIWDADIGEEIIRLEHEDAVHSVVFSPDGQYLATASEDHTARMWDAHDGEEIVRINHEGAVRSVVFSPNRQYLATASGDGSLRLWESGRPEQEIAWVVRDNVRHPVAFSPDEKYQGMAGSDSATWLWGAGSYGRARLGWRQKEYSVAFSPDGKHVATASRDANTVWLWDATSGDRVAEMNHETKPQFIRFSPHGGYLATVDVNHSARVWDVESRRTVVRLMGDIGRSICFSPDERYLATASGNIAQVWEWKAHSVAKTVAQFAGHEDDIQALCFHPNGKYLATAARDATARVWEWKTHADTKEIARVKHDDDVWFVCFSADGKYLATASKDHTARVWRWRAREGRKEVARMYHDKIRVHAVAFGPDAKYLATGSDKVRIWEVASGKEVARMDHEGEIRVVAFSRNGRYVAAEGQDGTTWMHLWRPEDLAAEARSRLTRNLTYEEWQRYFPDEPYRKTRQDLPIHYSLVDAGKNLARQGDLAGARALLRQARKLQPDLHLDPEATVEQLAPPPR
ncbi:MAG: TIR domain-containing protein [Sedimentisphaerales bacterium]|nr:TIR domain-containing protein [Sedimentisphaerales bacterium]